MICWQRTAPVTSLYAYVTLSQCSPQSMQLSAMRLQLRLLLWTVLLLPALLGRCCAEVDCEKRSSYTKCVSEINGLLESKDEPLSCDDSGSEVICKHCTYIHIHTLYIHMYIKTLMQFGREKNSIAPLAMTTFACAPTANTYV